jgi:hypothetical protein
MTRVLVLFLLVAATAIAQPAATRRATNTAALAAHPAFYHLRPIVVVGELKLMDSGELRLTTDGVSVRVIYQGSTPDGLAEVRGEFWDLGKFNADDPRLATYDLRRTFGIDPEAAWPRSGEATAIIATAIAPATPPSAPSIRNIVLNPSRYLEQQVTVVGQFGGRNLLGDLPDAPGQSRWDFVLRSADAAIWVTNLRPRGKDIELALDARIDTGRWLEVTGTLQQGRGLQWLVGQEGSLEIAQAPRDTPEPPAIRVPAAPPPEVIFSAPTSDETDVLSTASVRIQFSRDMDPSTFRNRVRVQYANAAPAAPTIPFTTNYLPGNRVLEIKFPTPLEHLATVVIDLQDGILGTDKQPLVPWTLRFDTGAN